MLMFAAAIPRMFGDLPICVAAFKARKALADGDVQH
jgi:hypothetical protein